MVKRSDSFSKSKFNLFSFIKSKAPAPFTKALSKAKEVVDKLFKPKKPKAPKEPLAKPRPSETKPAKPDTTLKKPDVSPEILKPQEVETGPDLTPPEPPEEPIFEDISDEEFGEALKDWAAENDLGISDEDLAILSDRLEHEYSPNAFSRSPDEQYDDEPEDGHESDIEINNLHRKGDAEMLDYVSQMEEAVGTYTSDQLGDVKGRMSYGDMLGL